MPLPAVVHSTSPGASRPRPLSDADVALHQVGDGLEAGVRVGAADQLAVDAVVHQQDERIGVLPLLAG